MYKRIIIRELSLMIIEERRSDLHSAMWFFTDDDCTVDNTMFITFAIGK